MGVDKKLFNQSYFNNTRIIVVNPPYISAVSDGCSTRKNILSDRINQLTGKRAKTNIGQSPLECPFIELITHLAKPNTVIACILPNTHLSALGEADVAFREFLLNDFGLSIIFNYPQTNLFNDVAQNTSIFVGIAHHPQEYVKFIQSLTIITVMQLISYYVALFKGENIDQPRNLAKSVTVE